MTLQVSTKNQIYIDEVPTGYFVVQESTHTRVYNECGQDIELPMNRYNLTSDKFLNDGVGGLTQFETDLLETEQRT